MKKHFLFVFSYCLLMSSVMAQSPDYCSGTRYLTNVFESVTKTTVRYGQNKNVSGAIQELNMDIYQPQGDTAKKRPVIILAFGGSFVLGTRADMAAVCTDFAKKGYVTASIDYRLWPILSGLPDSAKIMDVVIKAVGDMKASVRYFRADAAKNNTYKIDSNFVFVGGISAGAITALHTAALGEDDKANVPDYVLRTLENNGGWEGSSSDPALMRHSSKVQAVINLSGGLHKKIWLDKNDPPFISYHGTADATVPYNYGIANGLLSSYGSGELKKQADAVGVKNYLVSVAGGGHTNVYTDAAYAPKLIEFYANGLLFFKEILCGRGLTPTYDLDLSQDITLFPNPTSDVAYLNLPTQAGKYRTIIYDQLGRVVKNYPLQDNVQILLNKNELGAGLRFIRILFEDKTIAPVVKKVIFE